MTRSVFNEEGDRGRRCRGQNIDVVHADREEDGSPPERLDGGLNESQKAARIGIFATLTCSLFPAADKPRRWLAVVRR